MYIWKNVIVFVQQIPNINKQGNKNECFQKQTFLIYIVLFLEKCLCKSINFTNIAQYPVTFYNQCTVSNHMLQTLQRIQLHFTTSAQYPVTFYNQCTVSSHMLQPVHNIQSHVLRFILTHEDLWSPKMCFFPLQTSAPHELTAGADTHSEHSQLPHVHVHSCTCRCTALCYTVVPTYTRRNILNRNSVRIL